MTKENRTSRGVLLLLGGFAVGGAVGWLARSSTASDATEGWSGAPADPAPVPPVTDAEVHRKRPPAPNLDDQILSKSGFDPDFSGGHGTSVADQPWAGEDPIHRAF